MCWCLGPPSLSPRVNGMTAECPLAAAVRPHAPRMASSRVSGRLVWYTCMPVAYACTDDSIALPVSGAMLPMVPTAVHTAPVTHGLHVDAVVNGARDFILNLQ